jgi:hypothetical protein
MSIESEKLSKKAQKYPPTEPVQAVPAKPYGVLFVSGWSSSHTNYRWYKP